MNSFVSDSQASGVSMFQPANTTVVLGASNVTIGWPRLVKVLAEKSDEPLDILTAHGMGRSFCRLSSRFVQRELPGIAECGLWAELAQRPRIHRVFCTDIGNDLLFGSSVEDICACVQNLLQRFHQHSPEATFVVARPPLESVQRLGWLRFRICQQILFPSRNLSLAAVQQGTLQLDDHLQRLSVPNLTIVKPQSEWYGLDPIHIRRKYQRIAFQYLLQSWPTLRTAHPETARATAAVRHVRGKEKRTVQPAVVSEQLRVFSF